MGNIIDLSQVAVKEVPSEKQVRQSKKKAKEHGGFHYCAYCIHFEWPGLKGIPSVCAIGLATPPQKPACSDYRLHIEGVGFKGRKKPYTEPGRRRCLLCGLGFWRSTGHPLDGNYGVCGGCGGESGKPEVRIVKSSAREGCPACNELSDLHECGRRW